MRKRIKKWLDDRAIKRFKSIMPRALITSMYKSIAAGDLNLKTEIVDVKKGKRRYTLLITHTKSLRTVHNLGRHFEQEPELI